MATKNPKGFLAIGLDDSALVSGLKRSVSEFNRASLRWNQSLELVGKGFRAVHSAIGSLIRVTSASVNAAIDDERQQRRLNAALAQRGQLTIATARSIREFNGAVQASIGVSSSELRIIQATLVARGVASEQLEDATKATFGLSSALGVSLHVATTAVAKGFTGQFEALQRYGIEVKSTIEAQQRLTALFGSAEAQSTSFETSVKRLSLAWADLVESFGRLILRGDTIQQSLDSVAGGLRTVGDIVERINRGLHVMAVGIGEGLAGGMTRLQIVQSKIDRGLMVGSKASPSAMAEDDEGLVVEGDIVSGLKILAEERAEAAKTVKLSIAQQFAAIDDEIEQEAQDAALQRRADEIAAIEEHNANRLRLEHEWMTSVRELANMRAKHDTEDRQALRDQRDADAQSELDQQRVFWGELMTQGIQSSHAMLSGIAESIGAGRALTSTEWRGFAGDMITGMGRLLVQLGTAALVGSALSVVPFLSPLVGAPGVGAAAGAAAIAAGLSMIGAGAAMGGQGGGARATAAGGGGGRRAFEDPSIPTGFTARSAAPQITTVNVNFGRGFVVGSERRLAREIQDLLNSGAQLRGA